LSLSSNRRASRSAPGQSILNDDFRANAVAFKFIAKALGFPDRHVLRAEWR
jgi:hypothetical protein